MWEESGKGEEKRIYAKVGGFLVGRKDGDEPTKKVLNQNMKKSDYKDIIEAREWTRLREIQIETILDVFFYQKKKCFTFCTVKLRE